MCGIFGYVGKENALEMCLLGLERLEYRGYDSAGIAGLLGKELLISKEVGKLSELKKQLSLKNLDLAIGHTRWATHGKVNQINAHPHLDATNSIALVHNGIIENCDSLREELKKEGFVFSSETDTEIIANLIAKFYEKDLVAAVQKAVALLHGQFAIALIHKQHPNEIIASAKNCPLSIGYDDEQTEAIISSDPNSFLGKTLNVLFLKDAEVARVQMEKVEVFDSHLTLLSKLIERFESKFKAPSKEGFTHFMLKEIYEQPLTIQNAYLGRLLKKKTEFESLSKPLKKPSSVVFIGCGTSAHAGAIGALFFEEFVKIPAQYEIASEAKYRLFPKNSLIIAISQSGETADTLSAIRTLKEQGHFILGICNVNNSTLTREVDECIFLKAGPEISVCSTKAFSSQIAILYLLSLYFKEEHEHSELKLIPKQVEEVLHLAPLIEKIAEKYSHYENFFFMGRRYMYPTCMEAALKLKELSYINANGYAAGEIKHGAIALIDENFPVMAFCGNKETEEKILSNLQELKARQAPILALAPKRLKSVKLIADDVIWLPEVSDPLSPFIYTIAGQLFAYFVAKTRGCDIDQPRNLAKSVTVE